MLKNYINWLKKNRNKPVFRMIFIVLVVTFTTLTINIIQGDPILQNMDFILLLIGMYGYIFLLLKYIHQIWLQFLISFIAAFVVFTLQMFSDGSYVDYTSFIVVGGVALFLAFIMVVLIKALFKNSK
ncbi:transporter [Lactococcus lactis]|uniref:transporter n=1 Tax=Lactococcus lactis TaxID=1358 RepID=UPI001CB90483|nr:transporter [Lactococcus lactis]